MTLHAKFDRYLKHLGSTVPVSSLHAQPEMQRLCALRHDVDHDLDIALEMAHREHELGFRATYFVLPSAPYWSDPRLIEKCLQLQDYGHEVGLHVNCMAEWAGGDTDNPEATLENQLAHLREGGVEVTGISAHGDRRCYEHNVSNYWCFRELRPDDPQKAEHGRTAEGPFEVDGRTRLLYPDSGEVTRPDGARQPLWSISMATLGLKYHAWHTPFDRYFSDSGGTWSRTPDPLELQRGRERWQVLMHPIHWQGPKRRYFFLSTARSGSRWLSEVLEQATPLTARHEYILNQDFQRGETAQKATAHIRALEDNLDEVRARLSEAWEELDHLNGDYAEVNVYLPSFVEELRRFFPDAVFVHLHRHPAQVVRSLMDRDWYDTPEDHAHPRLRKADEATMDRFGRVCQYVAETNERLLDACDDRVGLEELTRSPEALAGVLRRIKIPYHPRLGDPLVKTVVNATQKPAFPLAAQWTSKQKEVFDKTTRKISGVLNYYPLTSSIHSIDLSLKKRAAEQLIQWYHRARLAVVKSWRLPHGELSLDTDRLHCSNCAVSVEGKEITVRPATNGRHAYLMLAGSGWNGLEIHKKGRSGWAVLPMSYVQGSLEILVSQGSAVTMFAISYGKDGKQIYRRRIGVLDAKTNRFDFVFAPHPHAFVFDIAIYMSATEKMADVVLKSCRLGFEIQNT